MIASQALISGVFSLTRQAIQLGFWPRLTVVHTSNEQEGEIYILTEDKQPPTVDIRNFDGRQEIASFSRPSDRYTVRLFIVRAGGLPPQEENE